MGSRQPIRLAWLPLTLCIASYVLGLLLRRREIDLRIFGMIDLAGIGLIAAGLLVVPLARRFGKALLWIAVLTPSVGRIGLVHAYWSGSGQRQALRLVDTLVGPDQSVLDGYSGLGCLHRHAFYWWWINQHNTGLLEREGAIPRLEAVIAAGEPAVILYDEHLDRLPPSVKSLIMTRYRPIAQQPVPMLYILLRIELPDPTVQFRR